ncbi:hypothetical protein HPB47_020994 [Ixodes persulcatus]|uniref:Uncharacterized protein n=1 Tax=Ixodes persulcatus TaxID=34615 RepID=A0AC60QEN1_IXOPE|nr:hypothetical protein HPB47_020994 [Ixodes persulcatus]
MVAAGAAIGPPGASLGWLASRRRRRNAGTATLRARRRLAVPGAETVGRGAWSAMAEARRTAAGTHVRLCSRTFRARAVRAVPVSSQCADERALPNLHAASDQLVWSPPQIGNRPTSPMVAPGTE